MDSHAQLQEKLPMLDHSQDMLTQKTVESTTSVLKELPENTDAQSVQSSKSEIQTVQETAKTQKMFPAGKSLFLFPLYKCHSSQFWELSTHLLIGFAFCKHPTSMVVTEICSIKATYEFLMIKKCFMTKIIRRSMIWQFIDLTIN